MLQGTPFLKKSNCSKFLLHNNPKLIFIIFYPKAVIMEGDDNHYFGNFLRPFSRSLLPEILMALLQNLILLTDFLLPPKCSLSFFAVLPSLPRFRFSFVKILVFHSWHEFGSLQLEDFLKIIHFKFFLDLQKSFTNCMKNLFTLFIQILQMLISYITGV